MSCKNARSDQILAYYRELPPPRQAAYEAHLERCPACAGEALQMTRLLRTITAQTLFPRESEIDWHVPLTCQAIRQALSSVAVPAAGLKIPDRIQSHLDRCPECQREATAIGTTLKAAQAAAFPGEDQVDWDAFAAQTVALALEQETQSHPATPHRRALVVPHRLLATAAVLVAGLGLAYLAVRQPAPTLPLPVTTSEVAHLKPRGTTPAGVPGVGSDSENLTIVSPQQVARTQVALARFDAARYLAESRDVLLSVTELTIPCGKKQIDVSVERQLSTRLLRRKQYLEKSFHDVEIVKARRLAGEIETLLTDIASLENCTSPRQLEEIRHRVQKRQLMMRINLLTRELGSTGGQRA